MRTLSEVVRIDIYIHIYIIYIYIYIYTVEDNKKLPFSYVNVAFLTLLIHSGLRYINRTVQYIYAYSTVLLRACITLRYVTLLLL